jgi:hypothetical protein
VPLLPAWHSSEQLVEPYLQLHVLAFFEVSQLALSRQKVCIKERFVRDVSELIHKVLAREYRTFLAAFKLCEHLINVIGFFWDNSPYKSFDLCPYFSL